MTANQNENIKKKKNKIKGRRYHCARVGCIHYIYYILRTCAVTRPKRCGDNAGARTKAASSGNTRHCGIVRGSPLPVDRREFHFNTPTSISTSVYRFAGTASVVRCPEVSHGAFPRAAVRRRFENGGFVGMSQGVSDDLSSRSRFVKKDYFQYLRNEKNDVWRTFAARSDEQLNKHNMLSAGADLAFCDGRPIKKNRQLCEYTKRVSFRASKIIITGERI